MLLAAIAGVVVGAAGFWVAYRLLRLDARRRKTIEDALVDLCANAHLPLVIFDSSRSVVAVAPEVPALGIDPMSHAGDTLASIASDVFRTGAAVEVETDLGIPGSNDRSPFFVRGVPMLGQFVVVVIEDRRESDRLDSVRTDFLLNVSHEIKTPIAAIGLLAEALSAAAEDPPSVRTFAASLAQEVARLTRMSRDVIELGRIEAGIVDVARDPFPLADVVFEAVAENSSASGAKRIAVEVDADEAVVVLADRRMIATALSNLIENAIQYSRSDTTVSVSVTAVGDRVVVTVADQGYGIRPENLDRVFERFYREDSSRSRDGSGLGLSIVKHTAGVHQGSVSVTSRVGIGSTFRFELPAAHGSHE